VHGFCNIRNDVYIESASMGVNAISKTIINSKTFLNEKCEVKTTNSSWSSLSTLDGQEACAKISDSELQIMLQ
jgi:hypothetical protein